MPMPALAISRPRRLEARLFKARYGDRFHHSQCVGRVAGAIRDAARSTGASFEYLLTTARIESNLNPAAQAATSSAKGLYQFIDQTWLATLKHAGPALGYGQYADAITHNADGRYEVADPNQRAAIMRLRNDPAASATMAGAFTQANAAQLAATIGRQPTEGELYIAHFLGSDGAAKLINAAAQPAGAPTPPRCFRRRRRPTRASSRTEPASRAASSEVYATLTGRFAVARAIAVAPGLRGSQTAPAVSPDTAGVTQALAQANSLPPANPVPVPACRPRRGRCSRACSPIAARAVTQTVSNLWAPAKPDAPAAPSLMHNLFSDPPAGARKPSGGKT